MISNKGGTRPHVLGKSKGSLLALLGLLSGPEEVPFRFVSFRFTLGWRFGPDVSFRFVSFPLWPRCFVSFHHFSEEPALNVSVSSGCTKSVVARGAMVGGFRVCLSGRHTPYAGGGERFSPGRLPTAGSGTRKSGDALQASGGALEFERVCSTCACGGVCA